MGIANWQSQRKVSVIYSPTFLELKGFIFVYRLAEDGSLLKEGAVRLSVWALRACSYKTKVED